MSTLQSLNLSYNPFKDLTPNLNAGELVWAGIDDIKSKIERTYHETIRSNAKQVVLNWGPFGGGKTYSAYYFLQQMGNENGLTHIYVKSPKEGGTATDEFFKSIVDYLTFENIQFQVRKILSIISEDSFLSYLSPLASREFAKAIILIGSEEPEISSLMNRFVYTGLTKMELKKLGLAKDIQTDADTVKFLSGIISCFTGNEHFVNGRVALWLDEMEDLIYYSPKTYKMFSQILRELIDTIPERFLVFFNFTLSEGEENTIELVLGGAVWSRISRKIRFKQFAFEDAEHYCTTLLENAKIEKSQERPFESSLMIEILRQIHPNNLIPREINKNFNSLITYCLDNDIELVNHEIVNKWMEEYGEDN